MLMQHHPLYPMYPYDPMNDHCMKDPCMKDPCMKDPCMKDPYMNPYMPNPHMPNPYMQDPSCYLGKVYPLVQYGLKEAEYTGLKHAMTEVALIAYLMGMGCDMCTAHKIVESWETNEKFPYHCK